MYTQNREEEVILNYFGDFKGTLLDIGANDGKTLSNSLALIEKGWSGNLFEPSKEAFDKCSNLHKENKKVKVFKIAIGPVNGQAKLIVSGSHFADKKDVGLLSSFYNNETEKWKKAGVKFHTEDVDVMPFSDFENEHEKVIYDFISIDAEGMDVEILRQIDLIKTKLLCIEWNSVEFNKAEIMDYCSKFGMTNIIYQSPENLLICRP